MAQEPETNTQESTQEPEPKAPSGEQKSEWQAFIESQEDHIKEAYEKETHGLKSALDAERTARKETERQLREAAKKAEAGSAAQAELNAYADKLKAVETQNKFYDFAHAAGIKNLKLGWLAAQEFTKEDGSIDTDGLTKAYPELFETTKAPSANAGAGMGTKKPTPQDINTLIRKAAGYK